LYEAPWRRKAVAVPPGSSDLINESRNQHHSERAKKSYENHSVRLIAISLSHSRIHSRSCFGGVRDNINSLKSQIIDGGPDPQDLEHFRQLYGDQPTEYAALAMCKLQLLQVNTKQGVEGGTGTFKEKEFKRSILKTLDDEIQLQRSLQEVEAKFLAGEIAWTSQEPPRTELETLLRYRAANVRELRELLDCFERIRRLRRAAA